METLLVKIFATALALSQVMTTPSAVKTEFDRLLARRREGAAAIGLATALAERRMSRGSRGAVLGVMRPRLAPRSRSSHGAAQP